MGGLALSQTQKDRSKKKFISEQSPIKATKELMEAKQNTIGRALRPRKAPSRVT